MKINFFFFVSAKKTRRKFDLYIFFPFLVENHVAGGEGSRMKEKECVLNKILAKLIEKQMWSWWPQR